ncbi:MAG: sulfotransferase [Gomphosphaeria aponina SAG 52.96 = DSM 107014]|uniref:Sulfotransferase n=1 Tax=Gomphosphaeria aponina SAG 52.96 = DSM 107014 TaxID=1521640 RepID=A0A941GNW6_9CHRO|nr:sulfotransferase [Gomphosphaeria aponina SAG 52.96 = DSM 107014]
MNMNLPLAAIVCGFERGGTTLISEILRQHPQLDSGFEGGFLLVKEKPAEFLSLEPYCTNFKRGWKVNDSELEYICAAETWTQVYQRILEKATILTHKEGWIFDKTPKYMEQLSQVMEKVPGVPAIVIVRDPRAIMWSWAKRAENPQSWMRNNLENACRRYMSYANGYKQAVANGLGDRILLVQYENLCIHKHRETKKIFDFLKLDFQESYISFDGVNFPNVYGNEVSLKFLTEYREHFDQETCDKILHLTAVVREWHCQL